jgi:hypothetical protein
MKADMVGIGFARIFRVAIDATMLKASNLRGGCFFDLVNDPS